MADARALLRAHRAENRISHPHAAYSDAGKLLCKLCHENVKSESLWDAHVAGPSHRVKLQALQQSQQPSPEDSTADGPAASKTKRKMSQVIVEDDAMTDAPDNSHDDGPNKRSRTGPNKTPPLPVRRTSSNTPLQGVEIAIPSRPATPLASATNTPLNPMPPGGPSPFFALADTSAAAPPVPAQSRPISTESLGSSAPAPASQISQPTSIPRPNPTSQPSVDEDEWAAFEAEIATAENEENSGSAQGSGYVDATISAPALTAAEAATRSQEEENERRKLQAESELVDEREDAQRAMEAEFEEMEELENRVRRLKQRREELRKGSFANLRGTPSATTTAASPPAETGLGIKGLVNLGKENAAALNGAPSDAIVEEQDEEDDDDDDEEDDWNAFQLRR